MSLISASMEMPNNADSTSNRKIPDEINIDAYRSSMLHNGHSEVLVKRSVTGLMHLTRSSLSLADRSRLDQYKLVTEKFAGLKCSGCDDLTLETVHEISSEASTSNIQHSVYNDQSIYKTTKTTVGPINSSTPVICYPIGEPTVGKYTLLKTIGKGGYGVVKLAKHLVSEKEVAIKCIDKTRLNTEGVRKLFTEVKIMKMLNHPHIVKLYEVINTEETLYLVMEYIDGCDLFKYRKFHGRLDEEVVRKLFRQIVSAIEYCHYNGVIHRDLKEANILLDKELNLKITDFGLASKFTRGNLLYSFCGTIHCIAPELFLCHEYGTEVDVWALGVILYTLVTGYYPFGDSRSPNTIERIMQCRYEVPKYVSKACKDLLTKLLELDPEERATLEIIMKDKWVNMGYDGELKRYEECK